MPKTLSVILAAALTAASFGPAAAGAIAAEVGIRQTGNVAAPVLNVNTNLAPGKAVGLQGLAALPAFNSADAQAINAAELLAMPAAPAAVNPAANALPALNAAIQVTAEEAKAEAAVAPISQLTRIENLSQPSAGADGADVSGGKATQDRIWQGGRSRTGEAAVPSFAESRAAGFQRLRRALRIGAVGSVGAAVALDSSIALAAPAAKAIAAAPALLPHWLSHLVTQYTPYLTVAAAAAAVYGVNRAVQAVIDRVAKKAGWDKSTTIVVKRGVGLAVYGLGAVVSMHIGGAPAALTTAVAGLGTTAVTMASKTILGNALEASKVLMYHSFVVGDRIKIGDETYKVKDLSLRYVTLQNESFKSSPTNFTYLQLASMPITILHPYVEAHKLHLEKTGVTVGSVAQTAARSIASAKKKTWLWLAGGLAVAIGTGFAAPLVGGSAVALTALSYLKGAAIFAVAHNARSFILDFISKLSEKAGWNPQTTLVAKLVAEVVSYTIGGSWALRAVGTTWMLLLGGLGTTGLAFTLVTQDILSNLVTAGWLMSDRNKDKSFKIGDYVSVGKILGKVVDMNFQYVVLDHENGTHTLISYAYIKDNPFSIIAPEDLPAAKAKYAPPAAVTTASPAGPQKEIK